MNKKIRTAILLWAQSCCIFVFAGPAGESNHKMEIKTAETPQSATLKLPALEKRAGQKACLAFRAYLGSPAPRGWNNYLEIQLNGQILKKHTSAGEARLLRRGDTMQANFSGPGGVRDWWRNNLLLVFFGPGQGEMDARIVSPREEGYEYLLDVSDLVHYVETGADDRIESANENILILTNHFITAYLKSFPEGPAKGINLFIKNIRFEYYSNEDMEKLRPNAPPVRYVPSPAAAGFTAPALNVSVTRGGGMTITVNDEIYYFASAFSYPAQPVMAFNSLTPEKATGLSGWQPHIQSMGENQIRLEAESAAYRLERDIILQDNRLQFKDTLTNKSAEDIGIKAVYTIAARERLTTPGQFYLGGNPEPDADRENGIADNPTVFVRQSRSSLGAAISDEVFRAHLEASKQVNTVVFSEPNLGLRPGESYTLEYFLYPSVDPDYFGFVNRLRQDWQLNHTVLGPFCFADTKPEGLKISICVVGPWFEYGDGNKLTREQYRQQAVKKITDIRRQNAGVKVLALTECNLITIEKDCLQDGHKLPFTRNPGDKRTSKSGGYGYKLNAEQSSIVLRTPHRDSLLRWDDGGVLVDIYYPAEPQLNLLVQVEKGNYRYREILEQFDFLLNDVGFDGIYMDQFVPGGPLSRPDRCSYDRWDGRTVELSADGKIARKYYDYAVMGNTARAEIIRHVLNQNKIFVANGQPTSLLTAQQPAMRFHEMENDKMLSFDMEGKPPVMRHQAKSQLSSTPVILGLRPVRYSRDQAKWAAILQRGVISALRHGLLYYYYGFKIKPGTGGYGVVNHMFPFTPIQLGEGFLIGRERIITAISRSFITSVQPSRVLVFDSSGREKASTPQPVRVKDGWETTICLNDWNETAVIILEEEP